MWIFSGCPQSEADTLWWTQTSPWFAGLDVKVSDLQYYQGSTSVSLHPDRDVKHKIYEAFTMQWLRLWLSTHKTCLKTQSVVSKHYGHSNSVKSPKPISFLTEHCC